VHHLTINILNNAFLKEIYFVFCLNFSTGLGTGFARLFLKLGDLYLLFCLMQKSNKRNQSAAADDFLTAHVENFWHFLFEAAKESVCELNT